jgi:hypothetical protein
VELFAGTYRTALSLSRTFILPDSPRSLELQLQGDDLVELFLMFNQNVFGLEPATVRVREVRIGRNERRAARRRAARDNAAASNADAVLNGEGSGEGRDGLASLGEDTTSTNVVTTMISVGNNHADSADVPANAIRSRPTGTMPGAMPPHRSVEALRSLNDREANSSLRSRVPSGGRSSPISGRATPPPSQPSSSTTNHQNSPSDDNVAKSVAALGPYTTFQQLSFAPRFPLAGIADEYIIPPTYLSFVEYQKRYEVPFEQPAEETQQAEPEEEVDEPSSPSSLASSLLSPLEPPRWVYQDPKGILRGT